jgi:hypothetical protein
MAVREIWSEDMNVWSVISRLEKRIRYLGSTDKDIELVVVHLN